MILPDPTDSLCTSAFKDAARKILDQFRRVGPNDEDLRHALIAFIADIAESELIGRDIYSSAARELVQAGWEEPPHVFDPFSGGGSIPLEALRLGCESTASELNPVAWLLLKITMEWSARKGPELLELFQKWSDWVLKETERRLNPYYPADEQKRKPLAYLWARTVQCEAPGCGVLIPLIRNLNLSEAKGRERALQIKYRTGSPLPEIEVFQPESLKDVGRGTVSRFNATCPNPKCNQVTPRGRVQAQAQLLGRKGGASDAILLAEVDAMRIKIEMPPGHLEEILVFGHDPTASRTGPMLKHRDRYSLAGSFMRLSRMLCVRLERK